jgi:hypothetical protein
MATAAQIAANRRNALKSTGPKTALGKAKSSRNAHKHGVYSEISEGEVSAIVDMIEAELRRVGIDPTDVAVASKVAKVARSEVLLKRAQLLELKRNSAIDDGHTYHFGSTFLGEEELVEVLNMVNFNGRDIKMALSVIRAGSFGSAGSISRRYRSRRRLLSDAEAAHQAALRSLLE